MVFFNRGSTASRPSYARTGDVITEIDTEDKYRLNQYGRWEFIPPLSLKSKRIQTLFIPFTDQTGLIFGEGVWRGINAELHNSGCMIYRARTSSTAHDLGDASDPNQTYGSMIVNDFAQVELLPKIQMIFSFSDTGTTNSAAFIGLRNDTGSTILDTTATFIPNDIAVLGIGYRTSDTNLFIFRNDSSGAITATDTGIAKSTNVYMIEIEYNSTTSVRLSLYDINMNLVLENTYTTEIPPSGIDIGFIAKIQNANHTVRYAIHMFDYIRLEKTRPALSATIDP